MEMVLLVSVMCGIFVFYLPSPCVGMTLMKGGEGLPEGFLCMILIKKIALGEDIQPVITGIITNQKPNMRHESL